MADVFRKEYKALTELQKASMAEVKDQAQILWDLFDSCPGDPRMKAVAKTNLEQAVMWIVKGITE